MCVVDVSTSRLPRVEKCYTQAQDPVRDELSLGAHSLKIGARTPPIR